MPFVLLFVYGLERFWLTSKVETDVAQLDVPWLKAVKRSAGKPVDRLFQISNVRDRGDKARDYYKLQRKRVTDNTKININSKRRNTIRYIINKSGKLRK